MEFKGKKSEWEYLKSNTGSFIILEDNKYIGSFREECNAKITAAAPKLLKALQVLVKSGFQCPSNKDINQAEEAINKALN
jgi:hypothetical protein